MKNYWQIEQTIRAVAIRTQGYVVLFPWGKAGIKRACVDPAQLGAYPVPLAIYDANFEPGAVIEDLSHHFGPGKEIFFGASRTYKCRRPKRGEAILSTS